MIMSMMNDNRTDIVLSYHSRLMIDDTRTDEYNDGHDVIIDGRGW